MTRAPASANASAVARPMPLDAPVTRAVLFERIAKTEYRLLGFLLGFDEFEQISVNPILECRTHAVWRALINLEFCILYQFCRDLS